MGSDTWRSCPWSSNEKISSRAEAPFQDPSCAAAKSTLLGRIDQSVATALGRLSRFDPGTSKIQVLRRDSWKKQSEEVFGLLT
jgi:hypothetical protein